MDQLVRSAVLEVLGTMLNMKVQPEPAHTEIRNGCSHVAGSVGFIGNLTGVVYLYSSAPFARTMTSGLLGLAESDVEGDEMVNDAMGELTNMVVGYIKSRLCDRGMNCILTIPSIVRGSHFCIEPVSSTERRVCTFKCNNDQLVVEVLLKSDHSKSLSA